MNCIIVNILKKFRNKTKIDNRNSVLTANQIDFPEDEEYWKYLFQIGSEYIQEDKKSNFSINTSKRCEM